MSSYEDASFDVIIDKGTLDAMLCGERSMAHADDMCLQVSRVLAQGGVFVEVSYGQPEDRLLYLEKKKFHWAVEHKKIVKPSPAAAALAAAGASAPTSPTGHPQDGTHYFYTCRSFRDGETARPVAGKAVSSSDLAISRSESNVSTVRHLAAGSATQSQSMSRTASNLDAGGDTSPSASSPLIKGGTLGRKDGHNNVRTPPHCCLGCH